jgi:hypothetical protein
LLCEYYDEQRTVAYALMLAMEEFKRGRNDESWAYLFEWCENKDRRDKLFAEFNNDYPQAMMLKEGYELWK